MGLRLEAFYDLSFYEWFCITKGHYKKVEREEILAWKNTSMLMYASLLPHQKKGTDISPQKVLPFAWGIVENEDEEIVTAEDIEKVKDFWKQKDLERQRKN